MKKLLTLLTLSVILISCDKHEPPTFDSVNGQTLAFFDNNSSQLQIVINDVGSVDIQVGITTVSTSDRTVSVSIDTDNSTADPLNYTVPSTMTIPANSHYGTLTIEGVDNTAETTPETLVLKLDSVDGGRVSSTNHTVSVFQICPIPDTFMQGNYLIEQTSAYVDGPTLSDGSIVALSGSGTTRTFSTETYPDYCAGSFLDLSFNLVCGEIVFPNQNTICSCGNVTDWFTAATTNETYDLMDDNVFLVTFTDDAQSDCGTPAQTTYRFTKQP